jgi:large subunit ribosomal protein L25
MNTLQVKTRPVGHANALRQNGFVPGVIYGPTIESEPIAIARKDLQNLFSQITRSSRINLAIDRDGETAEMEVFLKVVDYDPITDEPVHVDFYHPDTGRALKLHVPVKIVGEAIGTKSGGILSVQFNDVRVHGIPTEIPPLITIDVSNLNLGESIYVRDIDFGNVEPMLPPERTIVTVIAPRGMMVEEEGAEGEEGEIVEGEAVEGEAPAAESSDKGASEGE